MFFSSSTGSHTWHGRAQARFFGCLRHSCKHLLPGGRYTKLGRKPLSTVNNEAGTCQSLYWNILLTSCSVSAVLSRFPCRLGFWRVLASSPLETLLSLFWGSGRDLDIRLLVALSLQQSPANSSFDCAKLGLCLLQRIGPHKQSVEIALGLGGSKCIRPGTKGRPRRKP